LSAVLVSYLEAQDTTLEEEGFYPLECGTGELRILSGTLLGPSRVSIRLSAVLVSYLFYGCQYVCRAVSIRLSAVLVSYWVGAHFTPTVVVSIRLSAVLVSYVNAPRLDGCSQLFLSA